jgi:uncharacterized protein YuzE
MQHYHVEVVVTAKSVAESLEIAEGTSGKVICFRFWNEKRKQWQAIPPRHSQKSAKPVSRKHAHR